MRGNRNESHYARRKDMAGIQSKAEAEEIGYDREGRNPRDHGKE